MTYREVLMPVASGFVCCPGMDECRVRMDALERPSRDTCTSLCVAGAGMPGAAIECVEMNWVNFIGGGFLLGCGRSSACCDAQGCASVLRGRMPKGTARGTCASCTSQALPQPTALTLSHHARIFVDVFLFFKYSLILT